ncbi:MAG: slipin family protein [Planctomycetota bacterium]|jgi:regulator of protease activity HflC (stomatin/prohibitin superfamily)
MLVVRWFRIRRHERGLWFRDREFQGVLQPGRHWFLDPLGKVRVDVVSVRNVWLRHPDLDVIARSGALGKEAEVLDLADAQRALVWVDGRFEAALGPGLHVLWKVFHSVRVEIVDAREVRLDREDVHVILKAPRAEDVLDSFRVEEGHVALFFRDCEFVSRLSPGTHAFWRNVGKVKVFHIDARESMVDISGQEIMTADKVTLRLNAVVTYRVADAVKSVMEVEDAKQALYREGQLALRAVIGTRDLDKLLSEKDAVAGELEGILKDRATAFGIEVIALGIRDVILPGEMKDLMNKVIEARKAAEASLVTRREETAAIRSQANTAKILAQNPTLMRLRELEVLEKVAGNTKLSVVLGEKGLAEKVVNLL